MLKTIKSIIVVSIIISTLSFAGDSKSLGKELTLTETTIISQILDTPEEFLGDTGLVTGTIIDVCKKRGCWMEIAEDSTFKSILIKVKDGEIIFPLSSKGNIALVEGVVEKLVFTIEDLIRQKQHHAEEHGTKFDPATVTEGKTIYRIRGIGAEIE